MQSRFDTLEEIRRLPGGAALRLAFSGGAVAEMPASDLWRACRSAEGVLRQLHGVAPPSDLTITTLQPVGDYAVNIAFSDGEVRGIYPFSLLGQLAARASAGVPHAA